MGFLECMIKNKAFKYRDNGCTTLAYFRHEASEFRSGKYLVSPIENKDNTEEFINRTDSTFNLSNNTSISCALYSLVLMGESMINSEAVERSTPMMSLMA